MAEISTTMWTVLIITDDLELHRVYRMSPRTELAIVMQTWRDDCRLFGNWSFTSTNGDTEYDMKFMTLEMVGEMSPNTYAVTLKAHQVSKAIPVCKIFVYLGGDFHHITVTPKQRLRDILWCLGKQPLSLKHEGAVLDLNSTIKHAGLKNNAIICESSCEIQVKLSMNVTQTIQMDADSLVCHLIERVCFFETDDDFHLMHRGRQLELHENVKSLEQVIEVVRDDYVVNFRHRQVTFQIKGQSVKFSDFISKLSSKTQINQQELEEMKYYCTGCQRCISKAANEDYMQVMKIDCCKVKSLRLVAKPACETNDQSELDVRTKFIQRIYDDLLRSAVFEASREDCKRLKDRLEDQGIGYNGVAKWRRELRKIIGDFERKIKTLEDEKKKLQGDLETTNETLKARNVELEVERAKKVDLEATMKKLEEEIKANKEVLETRNVELETQRARNVELEANIRNHLETLGTNVTKLLNESTANNETIEAKTGDLETNINRLLEESKANNEAMKAKTGDLDTNINRLLAESKANNEAMKEKTGGLETSINRLLAESKANNEAMKAKTGGLETNIKNELDDLRGYLLNFSKINTDPGVKLFVSYLASDFSPVDSRPELQSRGQCSDNSSVHFIRCEVAELRPGWTSFEAVRAAVQPFFTGPVIRMIFQSRGSVDGREFAMVTSREDNETRYGTNCYLSPDGREIKERDLKNYQGGYFKEGGQIFIPNGQRRTVLWILK